MRVHVRSVKDLSSHVCHSHSKQVSVVCRLAWNCTTGTVQLLARADRKEQVGEYAEVCIPRLVSSRLVSLLVATRPLSILAIPKANNVFVLELEQGYTLYGNQLVGRAADRVSRKWKERRTVDL